jgi:hypothetical protein
MKIKIIKENFDKAMKEFAEVPGERGGEEPGPGSLKQKVLDLFEKVVIRGSTVPSKPDLSLSELLEKYRWEGEGRTLGNEDPVADAIVAFVEELLGEQAQDQSPEPPEAI